MSDPPSDTPTTPDRACPGCGRVAAADSAFCAACGTRLARNAGGTAAWSSGDLLRGERRPVTVALSDLCGYTAMSESLDPEEVASMMNSIKTEAVRIVEAHGGIVNQFVGDQVVSLFGIPTAHTDDARRAIAAVLQIHEFVRNMVQGADHDARRALRMHTGIQSGVVVAELRNRLDGVYGLTGDPINTAARLLGLAEADQVLIGEATRTQVDQYFETRHGGDHAVKGKAQDLGTYVVVGPRADEVSFDSARARGLTPWTGRADELAWLRDALEAAIAGHGEVIAVEGEAGAGKSRLCHEFLAAIARERAAVFTGHCQSYGYVIPYLPFVEVLRSCLGLQEQQSRESIAERTVAGVREIDPALHQHLPYYLQLLSASSPDHPPQEGGSPDDVARLIQESIVAFIQALSAQRPVVLFLDDWHWADEASQATLNALARCVPDNPILVLVARRPGRQSHWDTTPTRTSVLEPFGADETGDIVARCLDSALVDPPLVARIHERTNGNPLFVEEICRSLAQTEKVRRDAGGVLLAEGDVEDLELPETVQAVLLSRVDDLKPPLSDLLRVASVIGQEFSHEILDRLVPPGWPTDRLLLELESLGFVERLPRDELSE